MKSDRFPYKEVEGVAPTTRRVLDQRMARPADERGAVFEKLGTNTGLARSGSERLESIARELDECFLVRRHMRADEDARRFESERRISGGSERAQPKS
jgi:hypothetical protein